MARIHISASSRITAVFALFAGLAVADRARAQTPYDPNQPVDVSPTIVSAPPAVLSQGGAYIGIAEGVAGMKFNPAALGNRFAYFGNDWFDWDWNIDFTILAPSDLLEVDFFNSGRESLNVDGFTNYNLGFSVYLGRFGLGINASNSAIDECGPNVTSCGGLFNAQGNRTQISVIRLGAGYAFLDGDLVAGASFVGPVLQFSVNGDDSASPGISGAGIELGLLWRPVHEPYRIGLAFTPAVSGLVDRSEGDRVGDRLLPPELQLPWTLGIGTAYSVGTRPMNLRASFGDESIEGDDYEAYERGHQQVALDLVLVGGAGSDNTVGLDGWFEQESQAVVQKPRLSVRAGYQGELWRNRMIVRGGFYVEPSRFRESSARPHVTGGVDFRLFKLIWMWRAGLALDIAPQFAQISLSGGFWY